MTIIGHNIKFDLGCIRSTFKLTPPEDINIHDTMVMAFLVNPYSDMGLKELSIKELGVPDWSIDKKYLKDMQTAPIKSVSRYAIKDVENTYLLALNLKQKIELLGLVGAYKNEMLTLVNLFLNEGYGLKGDSLLCHGLRPKIDAWVSAQRDITLSMLNNLLRVDGKPTVDNLDSPKQIAMAFTDLGVFSTKIFTASGAVSSGKKSMVSANITEKFKYLVQTLEYYRKINKIREFYDRIGEILVAGNGRIYFSWRQFLTDAGGAKTGRLASVPSILNIPSYVEGLPNLREIFLPDEGHIWGKRDWSQQELRLAAHFAGGPMAKIYLDDSKADLYSIISQRLTASASMPVSRSVAKTLYLGLSYGLGIKSFAEKLNISDQKASLLRAVFLSEFKEVAAVMQETKSKAAAGDCITTLGGRNYTAKLGGKEYAKPYQVYNHLIQGSGADCLKRAIRNYTQAAKHGRFLFTVHDEINITAPPDKMDKELKILDECMLDVGVSVPMVSDAYKGSNWGKLERVQ